MANADFLVDLPIEREQIYKAYRGDEAAVIEQLLDEAKLEPIQLENIRNTARKFVTDVRRRRVGKSGLDAFLFEYDLSSEEGVALMCLAEALLRIPDSSTADSIIRDKLTAQDWEQHLGKSKSTFVNAATWALMLTGKVMSPAEISPINLSAVVHKLVQRGGEPIVREAVMQAMRILGKQFVMGETIEKATVRAKEHEKKGFSYSYDMLGEEAITQPDADRYFANYMHAITVLGDTSTEQDIYASPGISVKLSALHPRYSWDQRTRVLSELYPRIKELAVAAKNAQIGFTIDAEEAERLDLSLDIIEKLVADSDLQDWAGFGIAVQAYQKRAPLVVDYIINLARKHERRIMLRLVKGAYWDAEIKWSQEKGLTGYPVFTRKASTDICYIACVKKILAATDVLYPQFATHNAYSVALVLELAGDYKDYEFQCLHGMGDALYASIVGNEQYDLPCRIYAPVGVHKDLLPYLVRRLLENGANTSFVNRIVDEKAPIEDLIGSPCEKIADLSFKPHPKIPLPVAIYGEERPNSLGIDFTNPLEYGQLLSDLNTHLEAPNFSRPVDFNQEEVSAVIDRAAAAQQAWCLVTTADRVKYLRSMARLLEQDTNQLMYAIIHEGKRTIADAMAELREAIDFCWYYAERAEGDFTEQVLTGPTGELNRYSLHGRGIVACISPWNFPLAIFLGQVAAALLAGNVVLAKPAGQTPGIAAMAVVLLHRAGIPEDVVQLVPGYGSIAGESLINDKRIRAYIFTGSTATARHINQVLANRDGPIVPFIAETGGQNAMLVDSSALPEQVIKDIILSAFGSAGQRCSSLRVLYVQDDVAEHMLQMLAGAMDQLVIGDPFELATDIGPVIDQVALDKLIEHRELMKREARLIHACKLPDNLEGTFFAPCAFEIDSILQLKGEVFGPILHVVRYRASDLDRVLDDINTVGFGLTLGIHSRVDSMAEYIIKRVRVGNIYVNRNMIGAVVGVQPFGGEGLSGTGPKAGGQYYLPRLANEQSVSINTAATGGNASLMCLQED